MRGKTEGIGKIIDKILLKKGITRNIQLNKIRTTLSSIFNEDEMSHIKVGYIKNKKLFIFLDSASLMYEIKCFKKDVLLEKIKEDNSIDLSDICLFMDH